ncbi:response regulator [bacterium]|nr:response regulator [bacterium]
MKRQHSAIIVDDERLARKDLMVMLDDFPEVKVLGEAEDVTSAAKMIEQHNPDLIFLDIQMPGESGFDLLEKVSPEARIIFVTAYDEYAIRAFEVNALDYLLKPVNPARLAKALERLEIEEETLVPQTRRLRYDDRLFILIDNHLKFLKIGGILCINSAGDYSEIIFTDGQKGLTQKPLKEWEQRLPENYFCRIHRCTIINMEHIDRLEDWFNHSFRVYLKGLEIPFIISRRYAALLKHRLG